MRLHTNVPLTHAGPLYRYTRDLLALDSHRPPSCNLPSPRFCEVVTPLNSNRWEDAPPDRAFATYIIRGIEHGFRVGFQFGTLSCRSSHANTPSASQCSDMIDELLFFCSRVCSRTHLGSLRSTLVANGTHQSPRGSP